MVYKFPDLLRVVEKHLSLFYGLRKPVTGFFWVSNPDKIKMATAFYTTTDSHLRETVKRTRRKTISLRWLQNETLPKTVAFQNKQNEQTRMLLGSSGRSIERIASKVDIRLQLFWFQENHISYRNSLYEYTYDTTQLLSGIVVQRLDSWEECQRAPKTILEKSLSAFIKKNPQLFPEVLCPSPLNNLMGIIWRNEKDDSQTCTLFDIGKKANKDIDLGDRLLHPIQTFAGIRNTAWLNNGNAFALLVEDEKGTESLMISDMNLSNLTWKQFVVMEMKQMYGSMDLHTSHDSKYVVVHSQTLNSTEVVVFPTTSERKNILDSQRRFQMEGINQVTHGGDYFYWIHRPAYGKPQVFYVLKDLANPHASIQLQLPLQDLVLLDLYVTKDYIVVLCRQQTFLYLFKTKCSEIPYDYLISTLSKDRRGMNLSYHPLWEPITFPFKADSATFCRQSDSWSYIHNKLLIYFASPTVPIQVYCLDLATGVMEPSLSRRKQSSPSPKACSLSSLEWHRLWTSEQLNSMNEKDKQISVSSIPYTIVHKKGIRRNGRVPVLLESYGCYGQNLDTQLSPNMMLLLEQGWILW